MAIYYYLKYQINCGWNMGIIAVFPLLVKKTIPVSNFQYAPARLLFAPAVFSKGHEGFYGVAFTMYQFLSSVVLST